MSLNPRNSLEWDGLLSQGTEFNPEPFCTHENIITENGTMVCIDCGLETVNEEEDSEWKYYGINDTKYSIDPTQCYIRKVKDKSIYQDVQNLDISDNVIDIASNIYDTVCLGKVHRGSFRRAIIFAVIFHAYKLNETPKSCEYLIKEFKIKRKDALKGLKFVNENAPKNSPLRNLYITPEHLIREFAKNFQVSQDKCNELIQLYRYLKGKSTIFNRSRPQSVASGVIWYWIQVHDKPITMKEFSKKIGLSELTITKISKEIGKLL